MILLRIDGIKAGGCTIKGGKDIECYKYDKSDVGWFPIESATFGFPTESKAKATDPNSGDQQGQQDGNSNQPRTRVSAPPLSGAGKAGDGTEPESKISIGKFVDAATVTLMKLAMENRKEKKKDSKKFLKADIHFLDSVSKRDDRKSRFVFPYMMIHVEDALIKEWNVNATGDDRPQETMELWFDKIAMKYFKTVDGQTWTHAGCTKWDQHKNEEWNDLGEPEYFKDPKTY